MICWDFQESKDWSSKHPRGPVTWDAWCSICGFRLEDKPWANGLSIEGNGRKLAQVWDVIHGNGQTLVSKHPKIVCSTCCPIIIGASGD